jgi:phospholipase/carboxylesterase
MSLKKEIFMPLTGPRLMPRSGKIRRVVLFLHGYGADGNDLISLGESWAPLLPDCLFLSPHAPEPCAMAPMGCQWFPLTFRDPQERWRGVTQAAPVVHAMIDAILGEYDLAPAQLALVGFSQGTMMALHAGLERPVPLGAILGYSGVAILEPGKGPESFAAHVQSRPPVFLCHGDQDEVIPVEALFLSLEALTHAAIPCQWHISPGTGHGIDGAALDQGGKFLSHCLDPWS